ncbi:STAS domain-containing protein [Pseudomonas sp. P1B16]|jgi:phospholipid transport system transporter-binding protein|uniref:STAS domain-containing protein n=1 Tax=Pseudomonas capeferrum TaxID=1495066 RepID=A0ABY7RDJ9_9PSED|nr:MULTISPECIES: STAS domain-containing protein [Pseudomonas]KEY87223.1 anti-sigma factor antagonist [Pseudomonas capeferrum]KGI94779.1 anti-sigma factor antagonist [Pseudomonas sp. H2]MBC3481380.1 STAS domain-containing protein [Pseudomonas sp. SWRI77]MBC3499942.1 STAS domain-containing protein [Pseudomonas sp. SWRI59]MBC3505271.1 STAS domain-containing protein [Pseudomonas sp. SWRI68]
MSETGVSMAEPGVLRLAGVLDYRSGPALRKQGKALVEASKEPRLILDCSAVDKSSSVGLSLLLAFIRDGQATGKVCEVRGMPEDMREIAEVYDLDEVLAS